MKTRSNQCQNGGGAQFREAFTLVELLVVIAIIGVLIALLLPAVQAAREAARRMSCTNKLKQLALAVHNYHDTCDSLPTYMGCPYGKDNSVEGVAEANRNYRWSGFVALLPFLEMEPLWAQYKANTFPDSWWSALNNIAADRGPMAEPVAAFYCPSDNKGANKPSNMATPTNYRFCNGDNPIENRTNFLNPPDKAKMARGPFAPVTYFDLSAITDGTSNTMMFGERCLAEYVSVQKTGKVKETMFSDNPSTNIGLSYGYWGSLGRTNCFATTTNGTDYRTATGSENIYHSYGWCYAIGQAWHTVFTAAMPPNGPSCLDNDGSRNWTSAVAVTSYHPGGVNIALMDGAVRFIMEKIDCGATNAVFPIYNDVSGPSAWGIWGALGTRDCGEVVTLK